MRWLWYPPSQIFPFRHSEIATICILEFLSNWTNSLFMNKNWIEVYLQKVIWVIFELANDGFLSLKSTSCASTRIIGFWRAPHQFAVYAVQYLINVNGISMKIDCCVRHSISLTLMQGWNVVNTIALFNCSIRQLIFDNLHLHTTAIVAMTRILNSFVCHRSQPIMRKMIQPDINITMNSIIALNTEKRTDEHALVWWVWNSRADNSHTTNPSTQSQHSRWEKNTNDNIIINHFSSFSIKNVSSMSFLASEGNTEQKCNHT